MPWTIENVEQHKKGLTDNQKETWVKVANSALERCLEKGRNQNECEVSAIRQANSINMSKKQLYAFPSHSEGFEKLALSRFKKELIRVGTWIHPEKKWTLEVTPKRMDEWVERYNKMQAQDIKVPVPYDHVYSAKENTGFLDKMWREGNTLYGELEMLNPSDIEKIGTTIKDVSIGINPMFQDGKGNKYGEVIEHVALTNYPVVPASDNFQKVAAELGSNVEIFTFSRIEVDNIKMNEKQIASREAKQQAKLFLTHEGGTKMIDGLKELLGLAPDASDKEILAAVKKLIEASKAPAPKASLKSDTENEDKKILSSKAYLDLAGKTEKLEAQLATERLNRINLELNRLQELGKIDPVIRKEIDGGKILAFSRETFNDADIEAKEKILKILNLLPDGAVMDMKERTKYFSQIENPASGMTQEKAQKEAEKNFKAMGLKVGG